MSTLDFGHGGLPVGGVYTDFSGLAELRAASRREDPEAQRLVATQFEALFVKMMLKSMRDAGPGDPLLGSHASGLYRDLFDHQLSLALTGTKGLGLADWILRHLEAAGAPATGGVGGKERPPPVAVATAGPAYARASSADGAQASTVSKPDSQGVSPADSARKSARPKRFDSPAAFIQTLRVDAERAAETLGVSPRLLLAQAALETGWGRHVMRHPDGRSSHNLFGIKADHRWDGERVTLPTLELVGATMTTKRAAFRAYDGWRDSFDDYVSFIGGSERYAPAMERAADPAAYIRALQSAGYATDPRYAEKVLRIMGREIMQSVPAEPALKIAAAGPLSLDAGGRAK